MTTPARPHTRPYILATLSAAALPLAGWTTHAVIWHRRLAAAARDPLTGLLRRDGYTDRAHRIIDRYGDAAVVVIADVDHFKTINDRHGHAVGDIVLATTAARLASWAGKHGVVGRLGGDEFAVAVRIGPSRRTARLEQLARTLREPVTVDGHLVDIAVSLGAACSEVIGTRELSRLQRAADAAMYAGKHTSRAVQAGPEHATVESLNGRRTGRPGTHTPGRAA